MRKSKQIICIILAALTIISAPLTSYMEAQAAEVLELSLLEQLLFMFGINAGLGDQASFWKNRDKLNEVFEAAAEGGTVTLDEYGDVDFSSSNSVSHWFDWCETLNTSLATNASIITGNPDILADYLKIWDRVSYHNSGTSATSAMNEGITDFRSDYGTSDEMLADDIQEVFTEINSNTGSPTLNSLKLWKIFLAVTSGAVMSAGKAALPPSSLKEYDTSEFNEYDAIFGDSYFDGNYTMNAGRYVVNISCTNSDDTTLSYFESWSCEANFSYPVVGVINNSSYMVSFYRLYGTSLSKLMLSYRADKANGTSVNSGAYAFPYYNFSCNIPLYSSEESALNALISEDFSGAENIQKSYADFKSNTGTAGAVIGNPLSGYVGSLKSLTNLIDIIPEMREASDTYGGTAEMLPEIARILSEAGDIAVDNPDADDPNKPSNYFGILAKILAAINKLPAAILSALAGKFMTAERLETLLNGIPVVLAGVLSDAFSDSQISILPGILSDALSAAFPDAASAIKALIDLPAYIVSAVSGIQVKVPEITIPDIVIPEIAIPDIVIPEIVIPDIAVPDVFVEAPAVTLNPTFDITVANDYAGLSDVISDSVSGVMVDAFVPSETATLEKVGKMQEYFKFKDDMEAIIYEFKRNIFGIKPSPILKIPIGKPSSKKYDYGTGNYIIIDASWYAKYKDFGDKIVLAFAWAFFIWRMFVGLPGIISGSVGGLQSIGDAYTVYRKNSSKD